MKIKKLMIMFKSLIFFVLLIPSSLLHAKIKSEFPQPDTTWVYKKIDGKELKMYVFFPDDYHKGKEFPVFMVFHGGAWVTGDPSWQFPDCEYWSRRGMIAISVEYRLRKNDDLNVPLECDKDAISAILYLRENSSKFKIDKKRIVVAGDSAGGQMAAIISMISKNEIDPESANTSLSSIPNAVILWNPWFKCESNLSPPQRVKSGLPPFIIFTGGKDKYLPVNEMVSFQNKLLEFGNISELYVGLGGQHGFCNGQNPKNPFFYWYLKITDGFLVNQNMIKGKSKVNISEGVKELTEKDYEVYK